MGLALSSGYNHTVAYVSGVFHNEEKIMCNCKDCQMERDNEYLENRDCPSLGWFIGCKDCVEEFHCEWVDWNK